MKKISTVDLNQVLFSLVVLIGLIGLFALLPPKAEAGGCGTGAASPCAESTPIKACNVCHTIQIQGGNRNGTDRFITLSSGAMRHILDPKQDWSSTVSAMVAKGAAPADPAITAAYLNTNYCATCTGVIISSPDVVNIKDTSATITWTTSLNDWGDGPADAVVFYGTSATALTSQASDPTMNGTHAVTLTGLKASTKYYFQYQSTGADGKTIKYNFDTPFFRTTASSGGGGGGTTTTTFAYVTNRDSNSISVIDTTKKILQTTIFLNETPAGIVASPDGKTVYVSGWHIDTTLGFLVNDLFVIDTATNTIKTTVFNIAPNVNGAPIDLAISPDGQYLYGMHWNNELLAISTPTLSVVKSTILPCAGCARLAVSPDGTTIYAVSGTYFSYAFKIDAASAANPTVSTVVTSITMPNTGATAVAIGPDNRAWIPGNIGGGNGGFTMVNTNGTAQVVSPYSGNGAAVTPLGDAVFSSVHQYGVTDAVAQLDTTTLKSVLFYPDPLQNYIYSGVAVMPDGATVLVAGSCNAATACSDLLYFVDSTSLLVNTTVPIGGTVTALSSTNGAQPHDITLAKVTTGTPAGPPPTLIYSANGAANNVSVIDPATNTITATIAVGANPLAVAPSPDGKLVYVVNADSTVSVITRSTQTVTATITLPDPVGNYANAASAVVGPGNNVLYVANHAALKVYVINTSNNTITATIPLGAGYLGPLDLAITPDGGTLYVSVDVPQGYGAGNGYIAVVSTVSNTVVGNITLPTPPYGVGYTAGNRIAMNPLGGYLYATVDPYLVVIDTGANSMITASRLQAPSGSPQCYTARLAVTPDGTTVAASCWNMLYTYDTGTLQSTANSAQNIPNVLGSIAFNADGTKAYAASSDGGATNVNVIDMTTLGPPVASITMPAQSNMVASSPAVRSVTGGTPISLTAPDLTVTSISANSPVNLSTLNNITITDTVANIGGYKAGNFVINYYFSPTNTFNSATAVLIGSRSITGPFNAAATSTASTTFTIGPTAIGAGAYYVIAFADANQEIAEGNEDNNKMPTAGTVQVIVADLVETAVSSPAIGTTVNPGATISVTDTVTNQGSAATGSFTIWYFLVPTGAGGQNFLGTRTVSSLAAGATSTGTVSLKIPTSAYGGTFYLRAWADYNNQIPESNESNNSYTNTTGIITITPPDLVITATSFTPATITRPGTISVTFTVKNQGISAASAFLVGIYLSTDNVITTADKLVGSYTMKNGLGAGASFTATVSVSIGTSVAAGTYYVGAYADYTNIVPETNEANNGLAATGTLVVH